jgi:hypothetical protein
MAGHLLLEVRLLLQGVEQGDGADKLAPFGEIIKPGDPILGLMNANLMLLHVEIDVLLVADGASVPHEIMEDGFLLQRL